MANYLQFESSQFSFALDTHLIDTIIELSDQHNDQEKIDYKGMIYPLFNFDAWLAQEKNSAITQGILIANNPPIIIGVRNITDIKTIPEHTFFPIPKIHSVFNRMVDKVFINNETQQYIYRIHTIPFSGEALGH